ncbi:efflux transporter outer membrane subunit [Nitratidesulfovibrio sp. SRB-5]|uniref:efflux transporter outer membrane subunit n=1 Tax=Nitratidesulfovibrio sp. SRB-5 TaxID=2872636 RepID=UPI001CBBBBBD|nr:efflux transporter outer membrane subunit [Nitratidesulfovibrio sp. SRB-5]
MSPRPVSNRLSWLRGVPCRPCVLPGVLPGLLLCAVLAAGCAAAPAAPRPDMPAAWSTGASALPFATGAGGLPSATGAGGLPSATGAGAQAAHSGATLARWWGTFGDPALDRLLARAATANFDVRIAAEKVREARAAAREAGASLGPTVTGSASGTRIRSGTGEAQSSGSRDGNVYATGLDMAWEIDLFGRLRATREARVADAQAAEEDRRDTLVTLLAEVATQYVTLRQAQNELALTRDIAASRAETLALVTDRRDAGLAGDIDVAQAAALWHAAQADAAEYENNAWAALARLERLTGAAPGELRPVLEVAAPIPVPAREVPVGLPADLLLRRPDIRAAERTLAAAASDLAATTAERWPTLSLSATLGSQASTVNRLLSSGSGVWSVAPALGLTLFDSGATTARIEQADARREQAALAYLSTARTAVEEAETALYAVDRQQRRLPDLAAVLEADRTALVLARDRYRAGLTDFLAVADAERELSTAALTHVRARAALATRAITLYRALGGGWAATQGEERASVSATGLAPAPTPPAAGVDAAS